ncbi:MAG: hypothetical protein AB7I48_05230, partial [Planctomycetaceae bacterium]
MRASRFNLLIAACLTLGWSGCYGYCGGQHYPYGGYGGACDGYANYGYGAYGYPDPGYGSGAYDDCVDGGAGWYGGDAGYGPHRGHDRLSLRERVQARRDARGSRRDRRGHDHRGGRRGRHGDGDCCCSCGDCCGDCGWTDMDCCGGCGDCCSPCGDCCMPCSSGCSDCGPCLDGSSGWQVTPGCTACNAGMTSSPPSGPTCAGGNCPLNSEWGGGGASGPYPSYSHEARPSEPTPHSADGSAGESLLHPPDRSGVPEGQFRPSDDDTSVIRVPRAPSSAIACGTV